MKCGAKEQIKFWNFVRKETPSIQSIAKESTGKY